jgi:single-strand DNA-binding protein
MKGINKVILIGNSGKDPEFKTLPDGTAVAKIKLATSESYRLKNGDKQTVTEWHSIIVWRSLATFANQFVHKGSLLYIEGKLRNRNYEDKEGQKRYITEVIADQLVLLDKKAKLESGAVEDIIDESLPF